MRRIVAIVLLGLMLLIPVEQALAAISLTFTARLPVGNRWMIVGTLDLDTSYRNGGESVTAANLGLTAIDYIHFEADADGYLLEYDYSAEKVIAYAVQDSIHAALYGAFVDIAPDTNAVDLSGVTDIKFMAIGRD